MHSIKDQDFETLATFDSNGKLLFETTSNNPDFVNITSEQLEQFWNEDGALTLHNHPSGSTFSATDLKAEAARGTRRAMIVTHDELYILEPGWQGWGDPEQLCRVYSAYSEAYAAEVTAHAEIRSPSAQLIWVQHQALLATADEFGLGYQRMSLDEVFCFHGIEVVTAG